jgi:hypothetical protein
VLTLSQRDRDRLVLLHQVHQGQLSVSEGARRAGLGLRHFRRLLRRFEAEGDGVVGHGLRGRVSNRRVSSEVRERALEKAREEMYRDFGPTLLSEPLEREGILVHPHTRRAWMIQEDLWRPRRQGQRQRKRRERRAALGELVRMDTSLHRWLEGRSDEEIVLIAMIDDATSRLYARFFARDTGAANRRLITDYLRAHGRMGALYADRASHFQAHFRATERKEADEAEALTLIRRALDALEIELILALSPQAKGRVERLFKTLQDRLIKERRVAGISSLEEANRFLEEVFIPFWSARFTVEARENTDAHRPLSEGVDLLRLFAETEQRVIRADFTFRYRNVHYPIEAPEADPRMPKQKLTLEPRLDGSICYRWQERYLSPTALPRAPEPPRPVSQPRPAPPVRPIPADHPWRKHPIRVGRGRFPPDVASAALRPDSPKQGEPVSISP